MATESDRRQPPPPEQGEPLAHYIRRAISEDAEFEKMMRSARGFRIEIVVPWVFTPAYVTTPATEIFHNKLATSGLNPRSEDFVHILNHLWIGRNSRLPLSLRMAELPNPLTEIETPDPEVETALKVAARAGRIRDMMLAQVCEHLRSGRWKAQAFQPNDHTRKLIEVPAPWWSDEQMECNWHRGELRPVDGEARDRPTFLGLALSTSNMPIGKVSDTALAWMSENVRAPGSWKRETAISACRESTGTTYREAKAGWDALPPELRGSRGRHK